MGLLINMVSATGTEYSGAYTRIDEYTCDKNNNISARIRSYVSKQLEQEGKLPIEGSERVLTLTGDYSEGAPNPKKQIYEHMKTLPEYENGIDVLD